jgi:putative tricarboxylic transport membrane protein
MVQTPTWKDIADKNHFTTTFMIGDEYQKFLGETQGDVKTALDEAHK